MTTEKLHRRIRETSINIVQTTVESVRRKDIAYTGLRIYKDGCIGIAGAIGTAEEAKLRERAEAALSSRIIYEPGPTADIRQNVKIGSELPEDGQIVRELEEVLEVLRRDHGSFIFSNKVNIAEREEGLSNDRGLSLNMKERYMSVGIAFKEKSSTNIMDGVIEMEGRRYDRKLFLDHMSAVCGAFLNKVDLPREGRYPVIFSTTPEGPLMKFSTDLNGRLFATGASLFSKQRGKQVFSPKFTLYQSRAAEDNTEAFFDAEGTVQPDFRVPLIKDGVLLQPYTDKRIASEFGLPLTGAAVSDYDAVPALPLRLANLAAEPGGNTIKDLLGGEPGILVLLSSGGDFTPDGKYGAPVQLSYLYNGEKLIGRLPELQVSSDVYEMFGPAFRGVGTDRFNPLSLERHMVMDMVVSR